MKEVRWFKQHRLEWIAESLRVYGFINREARSLEELCSQMNKFVKFAPSINREYEVLDTKFSPVSSV